MAKEAKGRRTIKRTLTRKTVESAAAQLSESCRKAEATVQKDATPESEAAEKMQGDTLHAAMEVGNLGTDAARTAYRRGKILQSKRAAQHEPPVFGNAPLTDTTKPDADAAIPQLKSKKNMVSPAATRAKRKDLFHRKAFSEQAKTTAQVRTKTTVAQEPDAVLPKARQPDVTYQKRVNALKKQHMIHAAVKKHLTEKASKNMVGVTVSPGIVTAPKLPASSWKRAVQERLSYTLKMAILKIQAALAKAVKAAVGTLFGLLGMGGIVLLLALVIGAAAAIVGAPMGILFANESGDPNAITIATTVQAANADFAQAINKIVENHPECGEVDIQYKYEDGHTWASYWPEVLAVFAVDANLNADSDVVVIDTAKAEQIKDTFWEMHQINSEVETVEVSPGNDDPDNPQLPEYKYILHIAVSSRTVEQLAADKAFTADQLDILQELLSDEMRLTLVALCGSGILPGGTGTPGDGTLQWPLPGYTTLSTQFGEPDAFGRPGHRGIDIPAPAGTSILAAHGGTVMISGWNDSYGNQVLLDDGMGTSTRYAHMTQSAVSAGDVVAAGQVIGYVGSTGDSTGNHLHFEVRLNDQLINPMNIISP